MIMVTKKTKTKTSCLQFWKQKNRKKRRI